VRSYSRNWPVVFRRGVGSLLYSADDHAYLDFFAGAGALNYGHNNPLLKSRLMAYLAEDGIIHGLDMWTEAKADFLRAFRDLVLIPRGLDYKVQFTGPTGANAVEAACKLARKVTGRHTVAAFTRSFHGMSLGALSVSGSASKRAAAGVDLHNVIRLPFDGFGSQEMSGLVLLEDLLADPSSGVDLPAAVVVETVQAEGGVNVAGEAWLRKLAQVCRAHDIMLIIDDIQVGCGRTGSFFSFEESGIQPDIVCLSKSLSGYGLPMAIVIYRRDLDVWQPGEHNGTFRGHNAAFVTATAAIQAYWSDGELQRQCAAKSELVADGLAALCDKYQDHGIAFRGRGLIWGLEFPVPAAARQVCDTAFQLRLLVETAGPRDEVVKLMPPLTASIDELQQGLELLGDAVREVLR
jgi:diaminobutyrate-2-oxoglutarate transaminase